MILIRILAAIVVAVLAGCSSEGGVVGSGISSSISGNVAEVDEGMAAAVVAAARISANLPFPVRVSIDEIPDVEDTTGPDGDFLLEGEFAGDLTLRFSGPHGPLAILKLDVPAGSDIILEDIRIQARQGDVQAREIRQRNFFGRVFSAECQNGDLFIDDDLNRPFRIRLLPTTTIMLGRNGPPISCAEIRRGDPVLIEGLVRREPPIDAVTVIVKPPPRRKHF